MSLPKFVKPLLLAIGLTTLAVVSPLIFYGLYDAQTAHEILMTIGVIAAGILAVTGIVLAISNDKKVRTYMDQHKKRITMISHTMHEDINAWKNYVSDEAIENFISHILTLHPLLPVEDEELVRNDLRRKLLQWVFLRDFLAAREYVTVSDGLSLPRNEKNSKLVWDAFAAWQQESWKDYIRSLPT